MRRKSAVSARSPAHEIAATGTATAWWLVPAACLALVLIKSLGAPLGEPTADDFDFLVAHLRGQAGFFSGGGSSSFWRPIPHQLYYGVIGPIAFSHPLVVTGAHLLLLAACSWLLVMAIRKRQPMDLAVLGAAFWLLSEPFRSLLTWPSHFVELSSIATVLLAFYAIATERLVLAIAAFGVGLLCKESGVLVLPLALVLLWPPAGHKRAPALVAMCVLACAWIATYAYVRHEHGVAPPAGIAVSPSTVLAGLPGKLAWLASQVAVTTLGTEGLGPARASWVVAAYGAVLVAAVVAWARRGRRVRRPQDLRLLAWMGMWAAIFSAGLIVTYPIWTPYRFLLPALGVSIVLVALAYSAQPALAIVLVLVKASTLAIASPPSSAVALLPPETGAAFDFAHLVRLQNLSRDARLALLHAYPDLARGSVVVARDMPQGTVYSLGGDHALQSWYADTSLAWAAWDAYSRSDDSCACLVQFEPGMRPSTSIVPGHAAGAQRAGDRYLVSGDTLRALESYELAAAVARPLASRSFLASCAIRRARCLARLGKSQEAERAAREATGSPFYAGEGHVWLAVLLADQSRFAEALEEANRAVAAEPDRVEAREIRAQLERLVGRGLPFR